MNSQYSYKMKAYPMYTIFRSSEREGSHLELCDRIDARDACHKHLMGSVDQG